MPPYQASSNDMKKKGIQEHHEESLCVALQQEKEYIPWIQLATSSNTDQTHLSSYCAIMTLSML